MEDLTYLGKPEPYRTANQPMQSLDELNRIQGFDEDVIKKLKPFITAIPPVITPAAAGASTPTIAVTQLNVNTAPKEVLDAVFGAQSGQQILTLRNKTPFKEFGDFESQTSAFLPPVDPNDPTVHPWSATNIDVKSNYFLVSAVSEFGSTRTGLLALIRRTDASNWPSIVWQKQTLD
jgi:general secretion pathway protein K